MVKIPYVVGGIVILLALGAVAYLELKPAPVVVAPAVIAPPPAAVPAPQPTTPPTPAADCLLPGPPPVAPDGGKATADDMRLAHDVTQSFVEQLESYQACREKQVATADPSVNDQQKQAWREQGNSAVDEAHALAGAFSAQLKIYHTKHPEPLPQAPAK